LLKFKKIRLLDTKSSQTSRKAKRKQLRDTMEEWRQSGYMRLDILREHDGSVDSIGM
jgi:hypothetical protein